MNGDALLSARRGGVVHFLCSGVAVCGLAAGYNPLQIGFTKVHSRYTQGKWHLRFEKALQNIHLLQSTFDKNEYEHY